QFELMQKIAYIALALGEDPYAGLSADGDNYTYEEFGNWLRGNMDITVGTMDGTGVDAWLNCRTVEGITYEVDYTMTFYKPEHTVTWKFDNGEADQVDVYAEGETIVKPADPERIGYTFEGWTPAVADEMARKDLVYTAQWKINSVTITFADTGDVAYEAIMQDYGTVVTAPADPVKTGYTFKSWDMEIPATMPAESVTITALWQVNRYTLTFENTGDQAYASITQDYGTAIKTIADPIKTGYTFQGWSEDIPATIPAKNMTIQAQWTPNVYKVTLDANGGMFADGSSSKVVSATYDAQYQLENPAARAGYTFEGWYLDDEKITDASVVAILKDTTLTAVWSVGESYDITFRLEGGTWQKDADVWPNYNVEDAYTLPVPVKTGYTFEGWTDADGIKVSGIEVGTTGNKIFTANWTVNTYKVTWNVDGKQTVEAYAYGSTVLKPADPAKEGYTFDGWTPAVEETMGAADVTYTATWKINSYQVIWDVDGVQKTETYPYGATIKVHADPVKEGHRFVGWSPAVETTMPAKDMVYVAQWSVNGYSITFKETGDTAYETITREYGEAIGQIEDPVKVGHTFDGWDIEIPATMPAKDLVITAKWKVNKYTITFDSAGGSDVPAITQNYASSIGQITRPTREGYTFIQWNPAVPATMPAENITVTAEWEINQYTISFADTGDVVYPSISENYGTAITAPADPTKVGYTFKGWSVEIPQFMPAENLTITAQWEINRHTVTWIVDGVATEETYTYGQSIKVPANPEKAGYSFNGWTPNVVATMPDHDLTFTASWTEKGDTPYTVEIHIETAEGETVRTETRYGKTGTMAQANDSAPVGYMLDETASVLQGEIAGDGSLVLKVYYKRVPYTVTWNVNGVLTTETYYYGDMPAFSGSTDRPGTDNLDFAFSGWSPEVATVTGNVTYTAQYAQSYEAVIVGGKTYRTLALALDAAKSGDVVRIERNTVLTENTRVKKGVTLVIPCVDDDPGYVAYGKYNITYFNHNGGADTLADVVGLGRYAYQYRSLQIPENVTLTVDGTLLVNSVSGRPMGGNHEMDITGGYGQIDLAGNIVVSNSGTLECFGYIRGDGLITAQNGAMVGDLFIVRNWRGGTQGYAMFEENIYPMNESDCRNIEADLKLEYGSQLLGLVKMNANDGTGNAYYYTRFPQVSADNSTGNALIRLTDAENGYVLRSYDEETKREAYEIHGGAKFANSRLYIIAMYLTTADFIYPIDGDMDLVLCNGAYTFVNNYKAMPGATITAKDGADVTVEDGVTLVLYDEDFKDQYPGITKYPANMPSATLTLENGSSFTNGGFFAGTIYTDEANVYVERNAIYTEDEDGNEIVSGYTPVWDVVGREASGTTDKETRVKEWPFTLKLYRDGYTWRYGDSNMNPNEIDGEIIWLQGDIGDSFTVSATRETVGNEEVVLVNMINGTEEEVACKIMVAAYDTEHRMLAAEVSEVCTVKAGVFTSKVLKLNPEEAVGYVKLFLMDENFAPLADTQLVPVKH
ncbi:MAG: InlB B-repeat-containing protein, partial [Clostridia bacterium]|nr:InlB B-repeat-containing protein [Clostridia bacterium]